MILALNGYKKLRNIYQQWKEKEKKKLEDAPDLLTVLIFIGASELTSEQSDVTHDTDLRLQRERSFKPVLYE